MIRPILSFICVNIFLYVVYAILKGLSETPQQRKILTKTILAFAILTSISLLILTVFVYLF